MTLQIIKADMGEDISIEQSDVVIRATENFSETVQKLLIESPEVFEYTETLLHKRGSIGGTPVIETADRRLKTAFWSHYRRAYAENKMVNLAQVRKGICSKRIWDSTFINNPYKVAWLLIPPSDYYEVLESLLETGLTKLEAIMNSTPFSKNRVLDPKKAEVILKAFQMVDNRLKGGYVQKNIHAKVPSESAEKGLVKQKTIEEINKELAILERKAGMGGDGLGRPGSKDNDTQDAQYSVIEKEEATPVDVSDRDTDSKANGESTLN